MRRDWTREELNRMARGLYERQFAMHFKLPWDELTLDRQAQYRNGVRGVLDELERVEAEHLARHKRAARNTVAVRRAG